MQARLKKLCLQLHDIGALKFGEFKMKVGVNSPVYFDLRIMISFPEIMGELSKILWEFAQSQNVECDVVCGVPYTALPLATLIAVNANIPMLIRRKEAKDYGTKKLIEGVFNKGDVCVIIEDVVTTGSSILETAKDLEREGLKVKNTVIVLDREQGGTNNLAKEGITLRPLLTLTQVLQFLKEEGRIDDATILKIKNYIQQTQLDPRGELIKHVDVSRVEMTLSKRAGLSQCPVAGRLLTMMQDKQSLLCVAADVTESRKLLSLADAVGPHTVLLKTHSDIVSDWTPKVAEQLRAIAHQHNFLIMEDRKFADIGNTVKQQYSLVHGWADLVTVHGLSGDSVLDAISEEASKHSEPRGVFIVAQLSSKNNLVTPQYTKSMMRQAASKPELVAGLVAQTADVVVSPGLLQLTPGVSLTSTSDTLGQQYNSPRDVMCVRGADLAVVGRAITTAADPAATAAQYKLLLWETYLERTSE